MAGAWSDYERVLSRLPEAQQDALDAALHSRGESLWSSRGRGEWLYKEAVRRGWVLGPA